MGTAAARARRWGAASSSAVPPALLAGAVLTYANNQSVGIVLPIRVTEGLSGTAADVGLIGVCATLGVLAGRSWAPRAVLRLGSRCTLLLAVAVMAVVTVLYVPTGSIVGTAALRLVHGAGFALAASAFVITVADLARESQRGRALAEAGLAMPVALALFPVLSSVAFGGRFAATCAFAAILVAGAAAVFARPPPSARPSVGGAAGGAAGPVPPFDPGLPNAPALPLAHRPGPSPPVAALSIVGATALGVADGVALDLLPLFGRERAIGGYALFYTVFALVMIGTLLLIRRAVQGRGAVWLGVAGLAGLALSFTLLAAVRNLAQLALVAALYGAAFALGQTALSIAAVTGTDGQRRASVLGLFYLVFDVGRGAGVYGAGWTVTAFGFAPALRGVAVYALACALPLAVASRWTGGRDGHGVRGGRTPTA